MPPANYSPRNFVSQHRPPAALGARRGVSADYIAQGCTEVTGLRSSAEGSSYSVVQYDIRHRHWNSETGPRFRKRSQGCVAERTSQQNNTALLRTALTLAMLFATLLLAASALAQDTLSSSVVDPLAAITTTTSAVAADPTSGPASASVLAQDTTTSSDLATATSSAGAVDPSASQAASVVSSSQYWVRALRAQPSSASLR